LYREKRKSSRQLIRQQPSLLPVPSLPAIIGGICAWHRNKSKSSEVSTQSEKTQYRKKDNDKAHPPDNAVHIELSRLKEINHNAIVPFNASGLCTGRHIKRVGGGRSGGLGPCSGSCFSSRLS
jgi:hypothetical protein